MNWWETPLGAARIKEIAAQAEAKAYTFGGDEFMRIISALSGQTGNVTPENCMSSPTVHAIVTAISRRFAVTPVHVYRKTTGKKGDQKERLSDHPVAKLLRFPNKFQTRVDFWQDAASWFARYGNFYAYKVRGSTGPIRELVPMNSRNICVEQDNNFNVTYRWGAGGESEVYTRKKLLHARGPARNGYKGDSPVEDVATAIGLEIAAEKFGSSFFANGAVPLMIFQYMQGAQAFKSKEDERNFVEDFQRLFGGNRSHRALLLPKGIEANDPVNIDNERSQFLETRKYQRTVIAGAWGVPPHLVGDLERATFNNVEQQDQDFTLNVIQPIAQSFEAAMENDLLTDDDVSNGVIIRFNLDSILRADFKSRQEGLQIQRQNGVRNADEWREIEGLNPRDDEFGEDYMHPSNMAIDGSQPDEPKPAADSAARNQKPPVP